MKILDFFLFLWVIFALLDPDPDPATKINADPDPDPDLKHWMQDVTVARLQTTRVQTPLSPLF
jgi:hypothetical protein